MLDIDPTVETSSSLATGYWSNDRISFANTTRVMYLSFVSFSLTEGAKQIVNKINSFKELHENWDGHGAIPPSVDVIDDAISFVRKADKNLLPFYFAAPGPNGELAIEFRKADKEAAVYFNPEGGNEVLFTRGNQITFEGLLEGNYKNLILFLNTEE